MPRMLARAGVEHALDTLIGQYHFQKEEELYKWFMDEVLRKITRKYKTKIGFSMCCS